MTAKKQPLRDFDKLPDAAFVDKAAVAVLFFLNEHTIEGLVKRGGLPRPITIGGSKRWNVGQLREVLRAMLEQAQKPPPAKRARGRPRTRTEGTKHGRDTSNAAA